jgi:acyl carrier protein
MALLILNNFTTKIIPMNNTQIAQIAANVLYINNVDEIDASKSLFREYCMSRLDFVDFACELRAAADKQFELDQLWPVNAMINQPRFHQDGAWTDAGRAELAQLFNGYAAVPSASASEHELEGLFTVAYVAHRLRAL